MDQKIDNSLGECNVEGDYVGGNQTKNYYITMFQESERKFVVTHKVNIKPVAYFTGREVELQDLRQWVKEGRKSVLVSGMGGIGKTQICRKLFEEYSKNEHGLFSHIGYIQYDSDMNTSLQRCLKFKEQERQEDNLEAAWSELEYLASDGKLLLFVDNVNASITSDPGLERLKYIPGAIILTSRRTSFSKEFESYRIGFLNTEQCRKIYEKIRFENSNKGVAEEEVSDLEYIINKLAAKHTITVEFLAHLAWAKQWTVQKLRNELEGNGFQLEYIDEEDKLVNIQKSYEILYDLSVLTKAEQNILEAFSIFPYIPLEAEICNKWLLADAGVSEEDDILIGLYRKGWLQFYMEQESYALHPVFAQFIYEKYKPKEERHMGLIESCKKNLLIPKSGSGLKNQRYIPFAENILEKLYIIKCLGQAEFIETLAELLRHIAVYDKSDELHKKCLDIRKDILGKNHLDTARSYNNLAHVYMERGEYKRAEKLYKKSLTIRKKLLRKNHPYIAASYNNLAGAYRNQGEYNKAKDLYQKSMKMREKVLGKEHPETATVYNNLAHVYIEQNEYGRAERLYEKCLIIRKKVLPKDHPNIAASYNNLAGAYRNQKKFKKAKELYEKSLDMRSRVLGEEHPETAAVYNNLGHVYKEQGDYEKAERFYKIGLDIRKKTLPKDHPYIAASCVNLAALYYNQGNLEIAIDYYLMGYKKYIFKLGSNHPRTQGAFNSIKQIYKECYPKGNFEQWLEEKLKESD